MNFNTNQVVTIAGNGNALLSDGVGSAATFNSPKSIYVNSGGSIIYVADYNNYLIRLISCSSGLLLTCS